MRMKILSAPQVLGSDRTFDIFVVGQVVDNKAPRPFRIGDVYPVLISQSGTKNVPGVGDIVAVRSPEQYCPHFCYDRK